MPAAPATEAKVTGEPARSSSRSAWMALARVSWCRRAAAAASGAGASGGIGCCLVAVRVVFERGDDLVQVGGDLLVHLGDAGVAFRFGGGDDLQGRLPLGTVLREELGGSDEHRACETRVGMRAGLHERQLAVPVRERLGGAGQPVLGPGGVAERAVGAELDGLPGGADLSGFLPVLTDGGVG